jgi:hypothetical protein
MIFQLDGIYFPFHFILFTTIEFHALLILFDGILWQLFLISMKVTDKTVDINPVKFLMLFAISLNIGWF